MLTLWCASYRSRRPLRICTHSSSDGWSTVIFWKRRSSAESRSIESALSAGAVVKTTVMRLTLHLAAADDYPAYHQLARQARMRTWRKTYAHLDEEAVTAELREWFSTPRGNAEIRERVGAYDGV